MLFNSDDKIGAWTVLNYSKKVRNIPYFKCKCICGTIRDVHGYNLKYKVSTNCGCLGYKKLKNLLTGKQWTKKGVKRTNG
jgi:hypothetical protein